MIIDNSYEHIYIHTHKIVYVIEKHNMKDKNKFRVLNIKIAKHINTNLREISLKKCDLLGKTHFIIVDNYGIILRVLDELELKRRQYEGIYTLNYSSTSFLNHSSRTLFYVKLHCGSFDISKREIVEENKILKFSDNYAYELEDGNMTIRNIYNNAIMHNIDLQKIFLNQYAKFCEEFTDFNIYKINDVTISFVTNKSAFVVDISKNKMLFCYDHNNFDAYSKLLYVFPINNHEYIVFLDNTVGARYVILYKFVSRTMEIKDYYDTSFHFN